MHCQSHYHTKISIPTNAPSNTLVLIASSPGVLSFRTGLTPEGVRFRRQPNHAIWSDVLSTCSLHVTIDS